MPERGLCDKGLSRQETVSNKHSKFFKLPSVEVSAHYSTTSVLGQDNSVSTPCQGSTLCSRVVELDSYHDTRYKVKKKEESTSGANIATYECRGTHKIKEDKLLSSQLRDSWDQSIEKEEKCFTPFEINTVGVSVVELDSYHDTRYKVRKKNNIAKNGKVTEDISFSLKYPTALDMF